jgi:hypothetical protein
LASGGTIRRFENFENVKETTTERLSNSRLESGIGSILLPMPSNIQDGNSVDFAEGNLDGLTAQFIVVLKGQWAQNFHQISLRLEILLVKYSKQELHHL